MAAQERFGVLQHPQGQAAAGADAHGSPEPLSPKTVSLLWVWGLRKGKLGFTLILKFNCTYITLFILWIRCVGE